ncbi:MAG TPA: PEGA domain-containing protein [Vicinamibacterales bacterium]|nr:PEGA domain-containing protein [Vicinamibacterales bacterium]
MSRAPISLFEGSRDHTPQASLASWYLPGVSDGLGDRLLMFDNTGSASLELLRFKREFSEKLAFEPALRQRIRQFEKFTHPSVGRVRALKWLQDNDGLALISDHVPGRRLSEVLRDARGAGFALELIRQLTPALVALQQQGDGIAHGVLTPERIVVTPEGRLVLVEHVLGPAVGSLDLPATRLRTELGLAVPAASGVPHLNGRCDVVQLGLIALSLVLGRRVDARDYPHNVSTLLDEFPRIAGRGSSSSPQLRTWLEQALQLGGRTFGSAQDAHAALAEVTDDGTPRPDPRRMLFFRPIETPPYQVVKPDVVNVSKTDRPSERQTDMPAKWLNSTERPAGSQTIFEQVAGRTAPEKAPDESSVDPFEIGGQVRHWPVSSVPKPEPETPPKRFHVRWLMAALAAVAFGEGLFIAGLLYGRPTAAAGAGTAAGAVLIESTQPGVEVLVDGQPVGATPYKLAVGSGTRSIRVLAAGSGIASALPGTTTVRPQPDATTIIPPPAGSSLGGIRIASAIDLQVFEDGKLIGTTAGAMAVPVGRHTLDVVNEKFGYRSRQTIDVRAGQTATLAITLPNGRISINAVPWAEVWIGGSLVGDTPLANLALPLGEHEIVFKHPQLGERKQTALVRSDVMTRVTANLQR